MMLEALQKHTIKKLNIDFVHNGKVDGLALQNEVKNWVDDFMNDLDKQLSDIYSGENILVVDGLELDINAGLLNWQKEAGIQVAGKLRDKIRLLQSGITNAGNAVEKTGAKHFEETFLYFIENGYLPWQVSNIPNHNWAAGIEILIEQPAPKFLAALLHLFKRSGLFAERFSNIISHQDAFKMFAPVIMQTQTASPEFVQDIQLLLMQKDILSFKTFANSLYQSLLLFIAAQDNNAIRAKEEVKEIIAFRAKLHPEIFTPFAAVHFKSEEMLTLQKQIITQKSSGNEQKEPTPINKELTAPADEKNMFSQSIDSSAEAIYISNAGLVIIAAYLPMFFERIKLAENLNITNIDKAVCIVNYLATGNIQMEEYELVLPKIICGLAPGSVINTNISFSGEELQEANELLQSVIEHWSILKDASVEALRQTFLMRNGKLVHDNNEWKLQVEKAQFDMLLDHLPWNISMIKLGWMNELLTTEWM
jgi:hypothetical protein